MSDNTIRCAVIEGGIVTNIIIAAEDFAAEQGWPPAGAARVGDIYNAQAGTFSAPPLPPLDRAGAGAEIDAACRLAIAPRLPFMEEYKQREAQAQAFADGGYSGAAPARVAEFALPAGLSAQVATNTILAQAAAMRADIGALSELRMRKYEVLRAGTDAAARAVLAEVLALIQPIAERLA